MLAAIQAARVTPARPASSVQAARSAASLPVPPRHTAVQ
jgi:hypothetical protein